MLTTTNTHDFDQVAELLVDEPVYFFGDANVTGGRAVRLTDTTARSPSTVIAGAARSKDGAPRARAERQTPSRVRVRAGGSRTSTSAGNPSASRHPTILRARDGPRRQMDEANSLLVDSFRSPDLIGGR